MVRDTSHPEPMSTPECDLRGLEWLPLNAADLLDSDLFLESTGDEFKAAMALICASWRQVPAGSLPRSDDSRAILSRARDWTSVRTMAMRNWVLCSDGRYYHPIVAAKAMEALPHRQAFVEHKTAEADRKARERKDRKDLFAKLRDAGIVLPASTKTSELRERLAKLQDGQSRAHVTESPDDVTTQASRDNRDTSRLGQGPDTTPQGPLEEIPSAPIGAGGWTPPPHGIQPAPPAPTPAAPVQQPLPTMPPTLAPAPTPAPTETDWDRRKSAAWNAAKSFLQSKRMPKDQTGAYLGALHRDYPQIGEEGFIAVLEDLVKVRPAEPQPWLKAAFQRKAGERTTGNRQEQLEQRNRAVGEGWVDGGAS